ncbi:MAG: serine/threonine protein kinase [Acidimicrobiia bacterium]|nr:serine/threonine protein kinase [Acidimicrobiia bacterium]
MQIDGYGDLTRLASDEGAAVYRGVDEQSDRTVTVKVLDRAIDDSSVQRSFRRECEALVRLGGHPNIIAVLDAGFLDDDRPYLVTEYDTEGSLAAKANRHGPLPVDEVVQIGVKCAGAMATAHVAGVIHRAITPAHLLVLSSGEVGITGFDLAALSSASRTSDHTAPEVIEGHPADARSDIYSLCSTLWYLLVGDASDTPDVPTSLERLLAEGLAADPTDRPLTMTALAGRLQGIERERHVAVTMPVVQRLPGGSNERTPAAPSPAAPEPVAVGGGEQQEPPWWMDAFTHGSV